jgi:uncharacterized RDD family membrane protein YckC
MTQQGDTTSRPPGEDASLAGLSASEPGTASFPPEPSQTAAAGPGQSVPIEQGQSAPAGPGETTATAAQPAPWWPSPYLAEGQAAPETYPAPARPGQPKYGTPPAVLPGSRQPGFRQQPAGAFGRPRQPRQPRQLRGAQPRDPSLARGWERLLAMTVDWLLILIAAFLILYSPMEKFFRQLNALGASLPNLSPADGQTAVLNFLHGTVSVRLTYSLVAYGLAIACFWILQATTGATLGKLALGLRVVNAADRRQAGFRATGLRTMIFLAGPAMFTFGALAVGVISLVGAALWVTDCAVLLSDPERRSLHDKVAGTLVIRKPRGGSRTSW